MKGVKQHENNMVLYNSIINNITYNLFSLYTNKKINKPYQNRKIKILFFLVAPLCYPSDKVIYKDTDQTTYKKGHDYIPQRKAYISSAKLEVKHIKYNLCYTFNSTYHNSYPLMISLIIDK